MLNSREIYISLHDDEKFILKVLNTGQLFRTLGSGGSMSKEGHCEPYCFTRTDQTGDFF